MGCLVFNGVDLEQVFEVASVEVQATPTVSVEERPLSGDGAALVGRRLEPLDIAVTVRIATDSIDPRDIQETFAVAVAGLHTEEPQPLYLTTDRYRMAILSGETPLEFATYSAQCTLTFRCLDPVAYGDLRTLTVPSGGSLSFEVGGTYPAKPVVTASAVRSSSSLVWGLLLDNADYLRVETGSPSARQVVADCENRILTVAGSVTLPTLTSDWLSFEPGSHVLRNDQGTGAAAIEFRERWL